MKNSTHLYHISHYKTASGTNWSHRWTYQVFIINTHRDYKRGKCVGESLTSVSGESRTSILGERRTSVSGESCTGVLGESRTCVVGERSTCILGNVIDAFGTGAAV